MKTTAIVRRATVSDVAAMIDLLQALFSLETDFAFDRTRQRRGLELLLQAKDSCVLVAEKERQVVGMCTAQLLVSTAEGGLKAIIEDVSVSEEWRGQEIGTKLLAGIEQWAIRQGVKRLDLLADRHNIPALSFYRKVGWGQTELVGLQKKLYNK